MTAQDVTEQTYVLLASRVRESIDKLLSRATHPHFIAYLYLRLLAGRTGSVRGLTPNWADLGNLLEVRGGPAGKPYLRPFWDKERKAGQEWLNENLAGSFAPSSQRVVLGRVMTTDAQRRYSLRSKHWELAREHLLFDEPVPAVALAGFMFRDYGFMAALPPGPSELVEVFRQEYGYKAEDDIEFDTLYDTTWTGAAGQWFEPFAKEEES